MFFVVFLKLFPKSEKRIKKDISWYRIRDHLKIRENETFENITSEDIERLGHLMDNLIKYITDLSTLIPFYNVYSYSQLPGIHCDIDYILLIL